MKIQIDIPACPLKVEYDPEKEQLCIEGVPYAVGFFQTFGPAGFWEGTFRIAKDEIGRLNVTRL